MGKVDRNKQQKLDSLLSSAMELFLTKGIKDTSISDITAHAGVAKGTFYLYFRDKYTLRDCLISRCARRLFHGAHKALLEHPEIENFEDKIVFITDHIIMELEKNKPLLAFISKNLSWGLFRQLIVEDIHEDNMNGQQIFEKVAEECHVTLKDPDIMVFMIAELANATTYSALLGSEPIPMARLLPYLDDAIRGIVRNHIV